MPTIKRFSNCRITMYLADHLPKHFHVIMSDGREVQIEIGSWEIIAGDIPEREFSEALDWARENQDELLKTWEEYHA